MKGQDLSLDIRFRESSFYSKCQGEKPSKLKDEVLGSNSEPIRALGLIHPTTAFLKSQVYWPSAPSRMTSKLHIHLLLTPAGCQHIFFHFCQSGSRVRESEEGRVVPGALAGPPADG